MSRRILAILSTVALGLPSTALAQGWGPPPPGIQTQPEGEPPTDPPPEPAPEPAPEAEQSPAPEPEPLPEAERAPVPEPDPTPAPEPTAEPEPAAAPEQGEEGELEPDASDEPELEVDEDADTVPGFWGRFFRRFEFHGYTRMPLNLHFRPVHDGEETADISRDVPVRVRSPFLVDDDYWLSGFGYTRLYERDWAELFFSTGNDDVDITVGFFTSLYSDWAYPSVDRQFGISQASVMWRNVGGVRPLSIQVGMFWDRLGYIETYDTYLFGRTHQAGAKLGWDFANGGFVRAGFGAHLEVLQNNQGFSPVVYAYGGSPIGPVTLRSYLLFVWNDDIRPLSTTEEGDLVVFGGDVRIDFPWFDGPLYLGLAGYWAERSLFLAGTFELLHSTGGRGLTESFFGSEDDENGTGTILAGAVDWPVTIWGGLSVRFTGMLAHVWGGVESDNPRENRSDRTYLKWALEPAYQFLPWLRLSLRYDRVILDMNVPENAFRVITPTLTLTPYERRFRRRCDSESYDRGCMSVDIILAYSHYFYGDEIHLRPNQVPGGITEPDEDVFRIMARASW